MANTKPKVVKPKGEKQAATHHPSSAEMVTKTKPTAEKGPKKLALANRPSAPKAKPSAPPKPTVDKGSKGLKKAAKGKKAPKIRLPKTLEVNVPAKPKAKK